LLLWGYMQISIPAITQSTSDYFDKLATVNDKYKLPSYQPVAVGWKVSDINEFNKVLGSLIKDTAISQCHIGFVDKRYIASAVLTRPIFKNIHILKLMQRRPGSIDPVGIDHVDFYCDSLTSLASVLEKKPSNMWGHESNQSHKWISVRANGIEIKYVDHTVLDVCIEELKAASQTIGFKPKKFDYLPENL
jgi:hypothetical protein